MKIAIIGAGNMGGATARGLVAKNVVPAQDITVTAAHSSSLDSFDLMGMHITLDNHQAVIGADIIILAIKPWIAPRVIEQIRPALDYQHQLIVSMMPGIGNDDLCTMLGGQPQVAYVIPNTAIAVGESMTFVSATTATELQVHQLVEMFSHLGRAMAVPYDRLEACMALASCGIAFALRYIRASVEGGVELGMKAIDGQSIVAQTVRGAAALLDVPNAHAEVEIDKVTTPGGITIKGLNAMEHGGFTASVIDGLRACKSKL